jgi:hypothetical protein
MHLKGGITWVWSITQKVSDLQQIRLAYTQPIKFQPDSYRQYWNDNLVLVNGPNWNKSTLLAKPMLRKIVNGDF